MIYRTLGRTGLQVSILGMGTGGGPDPLGQKSGRPEQESQSMLRRAFELGINLFDTAPGYMDSEVILGRAIQGLPREKIVLSTKIALAGGMPGEPMRIMRAQDIEAAVDMSLRRLQTPYVDLLLIGVSGPEHHDLVVNEHLPVLERLRASGKVRFLGSTEMSRSDGAHTWLQAILPHGVLDVAMVAHNMINQSAQRTVFPLCRKMNLGVINVFTVRRVFGAPGRLEEVVRDLQQRGIVAADSLENGEPLNWIVREGHAKTLIEAAYRYAAYTEGVTTVMNGTNDTALLEQNIRSVLEGPLPMAARERLTQIFGRVAEPIGN
jgi:aryl-alcohol dehydrogenase-like predicted oxidoreductase